jgi:hypothetical protein
MVSAESGSQFRMKPPPYELVRLRSGAVSVRSCADGETMHPAIGPAVEAECIYVKQLRLAERFTKHEGEFVIWDVGLGAAANAVAVLKVTESMIGAAASGPARSLRLVSFDSTLEPLRFALRHTAELDYLRGREAILNRLIERGEVSFNEHQIAVIWSAHVGDFPTLLANCQDDGKGGIHNPQSAIRNEIAPPPVGCHGQSLPAPHAILFDPFSPAKNPAMWTAPLFVALFRFLDPQRPCSLATYSRSTMVRVALLLAGFFVGVGHPSGRKEETTIAANKVELIDKPLGRRWLERARRSDAAEPLWESVYRRGGLSRPSWEKLRSHPQFR